jgi:hypothetical protein
MYLGRVWHHTADWNLRAYCAKFPGIAHASPGLHWHWFAPAEVTDRRLCVGYAFEDGSTLVEHCASHSSASHRNDWIRIRAYYGNRGGYHYENHERPHVASS